MQTLTLRTFKLLALCSITPLVLQACASSRPPTPGAPEPASGANADTRAAMILEQDSYGDSATRLVFLEQGWGHREALWFYYADQGSVLMPYDVLVHLEQPGSTDAFIDPRNLARYRFLNQQKSPDNPDGLPVGFARHGDRVGLTCAACHTTQINYQGTAMRIDGAPALVDITGFFAAITDALRATLVDENKTARMAAALSDNKKDTPATVTGPDREAARKSLTETLQWFESYAQANRSTTIEGFGRLDAVGRIINQAIRFTSGPENSLEPNAPTNFPLLWDTPRHDYVQWTAFAPNAGAGSLGRNTGEVIGVFGHVDVKHYKTEQEAKKGYTSTVESLNLVAMEESLRNLKSPVWPEEILPKIDRTLAERGKTLYDASCASCHALLDRADPKRRVVAMVTGIDVVGTDDTAARNLVDARVPAGVLEGSVSTLGGTYGAQLTALELLGNLVVRTLSARPAAGVAATANAKVHGIEKTEKQGNYTRPTPENPRADLLSYKARPLNGIWAAAPYLHNGSVPTLYELLLPPLERPARFGVGRLEYDPRKVGYTTEGPVPFVVDTQVKGNSNQGHPFGTNLADADRWALVEYLKTL